MKIGANNFDSVRAAGPTERSGSSSHAFSLVEVLCAILILGFALVGLTQGITTALRSNKESELQTTAALYAAGMIEFLRAEGFLEAGEEEGQCGPGLRKYQWKRTITASNPDGLFEVRAAVLEAASGKLIFELTTLLFEAPGGEPVSEASRAGSGAAGGAR